MGGLESLELFIHPQIDQQRYFSTMSRKRRNTSSAEPESPPSKRRQSSDFEYGTGQNHERPQVDTSTGLAAAFPGLNSGDNVFYGPARDGIDYLRMVRSVCVGRSF